MLKVKMHDWLYQHLYYLKISCELTKTIIIKKPSQKIETVFIIVYMLEK